MADEKRRKPKNYYVDYSKNFKFGRGYNRTNSSGGGGGNLRYSETAEISTGQKGFLVTSITGYEVKCYLEIRQLLEDYYQELYAADDAAKSATENVKEGQVPTKSDGKDELEQELAELRQAKRHFRQVKTHCKNVVFIVMNEECQNVDEDMIVRKIFEDIETSKTQKTRYTFKLFPIMTTFKTSVPAAKEAVATILKECLSEPSQHKYSLKGDVKYFIEIQIRGNFKLDQVQRMKMIEGMAETVTEIKPTWKVDRESADLILLIIALREVCCVTFLSDYFKLHKYNMVEYYRNHLGEFDDLTGGPTPPEPETSRNEDS